MRCPTGALTYDFADGTRPEKPATVNTVQVAYNGYKKNPKVFCLLVLNVTRLVTRRLKDSNSVIKSLYEKIDKIEEDEGSGEGEGTGEVIEDEAA